MKSSGVSENTLDTILSSLVECTLLAAGPKIFASAVLYIQKLADQYLDFRLQISKAFM